MDEVFVFLGAYANEDEAYADYEIVKELHASGQLESYDAALLTRDAFGQVHVEKDELPTRHGAWTGAAAGAIAGLVLPPSVLLSGALGAGAGALIGHFRRGLSSAELHELGNVLDVGETGLVVVAGAKASALLEERLLGALATTEKVVAGDADLVAALEQASAPAPAP